MKKSIRLTALCVLSVLATRAVAQPAAEPAHPTVLHAARLLDVETGKILMPGEVLVQGERIVEVGSRGDSSRGGGVDRSRRHDAAARA